MSNWFQQQRMAWIRETVEIFGFINREHLTKKFGISQPQASIDLAYFMTHTSPKMIEYDASAKRYVKI